MTASKPISACLLACSLALVSSSRAESAFGETKSDLSRVEDPAPQTQGDGVYGRLNGDLSLQIGAGLEADFRSPSFRPLVVGDLTIYQTAGLYGSFRQAVQASDPTERLLSAGLVVSPLFLLRWSRGLEGNAPVLDLTLDSLGVTAGAVTTAPAGGALFNDVDAELGLQLGVPVMGRANGLWLRTRAQIITGPELGGAAWLWLSWQGFVHTGLLAVD
jgi:hypothetical protein